MQTNASRATEYSRDGQDGFRPLPLPARGEDLLPGRQYYLNPLARLVVSDVYGLRGLPSVIECLAKKVSPTRIETITTNLATGQVSRREHLLPEQAACFRVFGGPNRIIKFNLDLEHVEARKPFYADSPKLKDFELSDERPRTAKRTGTTLIKKYDLSVLDI